MPTNLWTRLSRPAAIVILTVVGGFVDAVGYMALFGLFTSSITGNLVVAAVAATRKINVTPQITVLLVFFCAATSGAVLANVVRRSCSADARAVARILFALELVFLVLFWIVGAALAQRDSRGLVSIYSPEVLGLASLSAIAMGVQNWCGAAARVREPNAPAATSLAHLAVP